MPVVMNLKFRLNYRIAEDLIRQCLKEEKKKEGEQKLLLRYFCFGFKKCFVTKSQAEKSCNIYRDS